MTKIDKIDLENIKLIIQESKIEGVAKIKIKKNDYEIEITSNKFTENNVSVQKFEKNAEPKEADNTNETINKIIYGTKKNTFEKNNKEKNIETKERRRWGKRKHY